MSRAKPTRYEPIAVSAESTVVAEFIPEPTRATAYQSEAELEAEFIELLQSQAYEYLPITTEAELVANLRTQLEALNGIEFSDDRVGALLHGEDRRRARGHRREDRAHPGGPRPAAQARRRHDQEHHADRQDRTSTTTGCR